MYLVLYKSQHMEPGYDPGDPPYSVKVDTFTEFLDLADLMEWIRKEDSKTFGIKEYRIIYGEERKLKKTLTLEIE